MGITRKDHYKCITPKLITMGLERPVCFDLPILQQQLLDIIKSILTLDPYSNLKYTYMATNKETFFISYVTQLLINLNLSKDHSKFDCRTPRSVADLATLSRGGRNLHPWRSEIHRRHQLLLGLTGIPSFFTQPLLPFLPL